MAVTKKPTGNGNEWLQSSTSSEKHSGYDHQPVQSSLYANNEERIDQLQSLLYMIVVVLFMVLIFLTSWKNIEQGKFPFNIDFMADIAYSRDRMGTPLVALMMTFVAGLMLVLMKRLFFQVTEEKIYQTLVKNLEGLGKIRSVNPIKPFS